MYILFFIISFALATEIPNAHQMVLFNETTDVYYKDYDDKSFRYLGSPWQVA